MKNLQQQNSTPKQEQELSIIQKKIREAVRNNMQPELNEDEWMSTADIEFYYDELARSLVLAAVDDNKPITGLSNSLTFTPISGGSSERI